MTQQISSDIEAIKRISELLTATRVSKNVALGDIARATNIPVRLFSQIESCNLNFYQHNKILFVRCCHIYKEFLGMADSADFEIIKESNILKIKDKIIAADISKRPTASSFQVALCLVVLGFAFIAITAHKQEKSFFKTITSYRTIYYE
jgi:hypothetical protein